MRLKAIGELWWGALAVGFVQVVGSFGAAHNEVDRRPLNAFAIALVLAGPGALLWCRRYPLAVLAVAAAAVDVYVGSGFPYGPIFFSVAVALFFAVQANRRRGTLAVAGIAYAGFIVADLLDPKSGGSSVVHLALVAGWLGVILAVSELVRTRRVQADAAEWARRQEALRRAGELRLGLAQELHDVLAHNISLINVQASVALHLLDDKPEQAAEALTNIKTASSEALHELRTALDLLRGDERAQRIPAPTLADLDSLVANARVGGVDISLRRRGAVAALPADVELAAYRIVQEALTNVARHSQARRVTVDVVYNDGVSVEIVDDGQGGAAPPGNGVTGMRERAAALGGQVEVGPRPGRGYRVFARLPVRQT